MSSFMLIDTHCHLDFPEFNLDRGAVIQRAKQAGIGYIINVGSSLAGSKMAITLAGQYDFIYASIGIHPHEANKITEESLEEIQRLSDENKVVAIGEIGLDYYKGYSQPEAQKLLFHNLLGLARSRALPVIIHCRQAYRDMLNILKEERIKSGVMHCFSGDETFLKECLNLGLYVSFTCNLTYKKAENLRNLARFVPLEQLMLETDAPFLPPEGLRGKRNEPGYLKYLAEELARIKGVDLEEIARVTTSNAQALFGLKEQ